MNWSNDRRPPQKKFYASRVAGNTPEVQSFEKKRGRAERDKASLEFIANYDSINLLPLPHI